MDREDKVILMTKLASYENNEGKRNMAIGNFFRGDYLSWQVLKSIICATIAYVILMGVAIVYNFEEFMLDIYKTDLLEFGKDLLVRYAVFVGAYGVLTYVIYSYRYGKARKSLRIYYQNLKKVSAMNRKEE